MTVLETQLNPRSADFQANAQAMRLLVDDLNARIAQVATRRLRVNRPGMVKPLQGEAGTVPVAAVIVAKSLWP